MAAHGESHWAVQGGAYVVTMLTKRAAPASASPVLVFFELVRDVALADADRRADHEHPRRPARGPALGALRPMIRLVGRGQGGEMRNAEGKE